MKINKIKGKIFSELLSISENEDTEKSRHTETKNIKYLKSGREKTNREIKKKIEK